jgi:hypothetical protein
MNIYFANRLLKRTEDHGRFSGWAMIYCLAFLLSGLVFFSPAFAAEELVLPLRLHLTRGISLTVKDTKLEVWVKPEDVKNTLLPEVNRIWKQADVRFSIECVIEEAVPESPALDKFLAEVSAFKRNNEEKGVGSPFPLAMQAIDDSKFLPSALNVYFFPYVGETLQGVSALGGNRLMVGVWSDKSSGGRKPPQKTLLTEPEPMVIGSLARTMAHELGHSLTLQHPQKQDEPKGRLMGGGKQGYLLTLAEITQARKSAEQHLQGHKKNRDKN